MEKTQVGRSCTVPRESTLPKYLCSPVRRAFARSMPSAQSGDISQINDKNSHLHLIFYLKRKNNSIMCKLTSYLDPYSEMLEGLKIWRVIIDVPKSEGGGEAFSK